MSMLNSGMVTDWALLAIMVPGKQRYCAFCQEFTSHRPVRSWLRGACRVSSILPWVWIQRPMAGTIFSEARKLTPAIAEFSELGEYLDMPVRTYSAGMYMRLAFAITTAVYPDILVMDEMIGAGDAGFLDKAVERVTSMMDRTKIVVVASHSNFTITKFCNKVMWMEKGGVKAMGPVEEILQQFEQETNSTLAT